MSDYTHDDAMRDLAVLYVPGCNERDVIHFAEIEKVTV